MMFDSFSFGHVGYNGKDYPFDLIVDSKGKAYERGPRDNNHLLTADELKNYLEDNTKLLIVGTGDSGVLELSEDAKQLLNKRAIQLITLLSAQAIQVYNKEQDKTKVTVIIHSTC